MRLGRCAWLVDHHPLLRGVLAQVGHDRLLSAWVDWDPLRDVQSITIQDDPGIFLQRSRLSRVEFHGLYTTFHLS